MNAGQSALELDYDAEIPRAHRLDFAGDPFPLPRPRARVITKGGKQVATFYELAEARARKDELAIRWRSAGLPQLLEGPLGIRLLFCFARPDGHYAAAGGIFSRHLGRVPGGGGKNGHGQRTGGDTDNCVKLVLDALNGVAYKDDGQVALIVAQKCYVDQTGWLEPCTIIELWAL